MYALSFTGNKTALTVRYSPFAGCSEPRGLRSSTSNPDDLVRQWRINPLYGTSPWLVESRD